MGVLSDCFNRNKNPNISDKNLDLDDSGNSQEMTSFDEDKNKPLVESKEQSKSKKDNNRYYENKNNIKKENEKEDKQKEIINNIENETIEIKNNEEVENEYDKKKEIVNNIDCEILEIKNNEKAENEKEDKKKEISDEHIENKVIEIKDNKEEESGKINENEENIQNVNENIEDKKIEQNEKKENEEKRNEEINNNNGKEALDEYKTILIGLNNIGATCYMNSTLQCLSNTDQLTYYFLNEFTYEPNNNEKIMSNAYYNLIVNLWDKNNNNKSFSPDDFKEKLSQENPLFKGIAANDSKDLIQFLIERFHRELNVINHDNNFNNDYTQNDQLNEQKMKELFMNEFSTNYNSIISDLFYGILEIKSQCQVCKYLKYNFQAYSFIEFPLEKVNQFCFNTGRKINNGNNKNPDIDLNECFEYYRNPELMTGDNRMYCNICKNNCDSLYETSIYSTPKNLIINLNRGRNALYECKVIFPDVLDLHDFVGDKNGNINYELYAVICHIGPSSMSGHFVAYCKNKMDKRWYLYNDAFVTLCENNKEYQKGMPYILFYQNIIVA